MSAAIAYSVTEDVVTPESAEAGDVESSDFAVEPTTTTLRDLLYDLRSRGIADVSRSHSGLTVRHDDTDDFRTGATTTQITHVTISNRLIERLARLTNLPLLGSLVASHHPWAHLDPRGPVAVTHARNAALVSGLAHNTAPHTARSTSHPSPTA